MWTYSAKRDVVSEGRADKPYNMTILGSAEEIADFRFKLKDVCAKMGEEDGKKVSFREGIFTALSFWLEARENADAARGLWRTGSSRLSLEAEERVLGQPEHHGRAHLLHHPDRVHDHAIKCPEVLAMTESDRRNRMCQVLDKSQLAAEEGSTLLTEIVALVTQFVAVVEAGEPDGEPDGGNTKRGRGRGQGTQWVADLESRVVDAGEPDGGVAGDREHEAGSWPGTGNT
ncbi:hypothetical protein Bbelb_049750 [Branchiostoma belcheri]|nr:hypothetical protein Bbelb_049750 [Branchiostoma belcheri]